MQSTIVSTCYRAFSSTFLPQLPSGIIILTQNETTPGEPDVKRPWAKQEPRLSLRDTTLLCDQLHPSHGDLPLSRDNNYYEHHGCLLSSHYRVCCVHAAGCVRCSSQSRQSRCVHETRPRRGCRQGWMLCCVWRKNLANTSTSTARTQSIEAWRVLARDDTGLRHSISTPVSAELLLAQTWVRRSRG